jgi:hypothetical protein
MHPRHNVLLSLLVLVYAYLVALHHANVALSCARFGCLCPVVCHKGVLYTHRSNYLHALITTTPDMLALGAGGWSLEAAAAISATAKALQQRPTLH